MFLKKALSEFSIYHEGLRVYKPFMTPKRIILSLFGGSLLFIAIGIAHLSASLSVVEIVDRYDAQCVPNTFHEKKVEFIRGSTDKTCIRFLNVTKRMKSPVYVYYELHNFFQNNKRYAKSRSNEQLRSKAYEGHIDGCDPETNRGNDVIVPCGLVAWSLFNDTFDFSIANKRLEVNKTNIAWKFDKERVGSDVYSKNFQSGKLIGGATLDESKPLRDQEDLLVWMRTAALPTFRKLYGKIDIDLEANATITVVIQNNYNTYSFGGKKKLVLSTTTWIGGKNNFLGVAYLGVGGFFLLFAFFLLIVTLVKPRPLGDPSLLSWNRSSAGID